MLDIGNIRRNLAFFGVGLGKQQIETRVSIAPRESNEGE